MRIRIQKDEVAASLSLPAEKWDVGFLGRALDDRGRAAIEFAQSHSIDTIEVSYPDPRNFEFQLGPDTITVDELESRLGSCRDKAILIDATTSGFCELLLLLRGLRNVGASSVTFVYVEPKDYRRVSDSIVKQAMREFSLSKEITGFEPIPGSLVWIAEDQTREVIFFLGFEAARFDRAFEEFELLKAEQCRVIFGVPAFKPGMEMDAFHNYVHSLHASDISSPPLYCGADNPKAAIEILHQIYTLVKSENSLMFVVPIGTKPLGIATAIYATVNPNVGILYDHPINSADRSTNIGDWHLYTITELGDGTLYT
jgi:hypothetical protein